MHLGLHRASMPRFVILAVQIFRHTCHVASKKRLSTELTVGHTSDEGRSGGRLTLSTLVQRAANWLRSAKRGVSCSLLEKRCVHI